MTWKDITMAQFMELQNAIGKKYKRPEQKTFALANIIFRRDITQEPVGTLQGYYEEMEGLMNQAVPDADVHRSYEINGRKYKLHRDIENVTTAQYIDFTNYAKKASKNLIEILGVFLIPDGHKYNDGYDMEIVHNDIRDLNAVEGNAIVFFLVNRSMNFMRRSACYSAAQILTSRKVPLKQRIATSLKLLQGWRSLARLISR